jgi:GNAT superfamily N-acetyltransferase
VTDDAVLRPLTVDDGPALHTFSCRGWREPWADLVEEMVRDRLVGELVHGDVDAVGAWRGDDLAGVAVWRINEDRCTSIVLAVANGHRRRGLGRTLKLTVIAAARDAGASVVVSHVHWDNEPMLLLNRSMGANLERIPGDLDYCLCVLPVT